MHEVAGVVQLHPGKPMEGGGGDIIVLSHAADRGIGVEAPQDGIVSGEHNHLHSAALRRHKYILKFDRSHYNMEKRVCQSSGLCAKKQNGDGRIGENDAIQTQSSVI